MRYQINWRDYVRQPRIKTLIEEKGILVAKQQYLQEQNKLQWIDPVLIAESNAAGISVPSAAGSAAGGSTDFITGHSVESTKFTWGNVQNANWTGSTNFGLYVEALESGTTFTQGHTDKRHTILLAFVTGSKMGDLAGLSTAGVDIVVTASCSPSLGAAVPTGSWTTLMQQNIDKGALNQVIGGFTNTRLAKNFITMTSSSNQGPDFTIKSIVIGATNDATLTGLPTETGSISITQGLDTFFADQGAQLFQGTQLPYTNIPRKTS